MIISTINWTPLLTVYTPRFLSPFRGYFRHLTFRRSLADWLSFSCISWMRLSREECSFDSMAMRSSRLLAICFSAFSNWVSRSISCSFRNWCSCLNTVTAFSFSAVTCFWNKREGGERKMQVSLSKCIGLNLSFCRIEKRDLHIWQEGGCWLSAEIRPAVSGETQPKCPPISKAFHGHF